MASCRLPLFFKACTPNPAYPTTNALGQMPPFHLIPACTESTRHVSSSSPLLCLSLQNAASHLLAQTDALLRRLPQVQPLSGQHNAAGTFLPFPDYADARWVAHPLPQPSAAVYLCSNPFFEHEQGLHVQCQQQLLFVCLETTCAFVIPGEV